MANSVAHTDPPTAAVNDPAFAKQEADQQRPIPPVVGDANVSPKKEVEPLIKHEERTEYRDEDGNILNEEQIAALGDKVSFSTRYETRTRLVDAAGNVILDEPVIGGGDGVAPPHPDVEGGNPETAAAGDKAAAAGDAGSGVGGGAEAQPATADAKDDIKKEQSVERDVNRGGEPKPGSEGNQATKEK